MERQRMEDAYNEVHRMYFAKDVKENSNFTSGFMEGVKWADKNPFIMQDLEKAASIIERMRAALWNKTYEKTPDENDRSRPYSEYCFVHVNDAGCSFFTKACYNTQTEEWCFVEGGKCKKTGVDYWMYIPKLPYMTK